MPQSSSSYPRSVTSGAIFTEDAPHHSCSIYCRPPVHAYLGYGSAGITEADVREAFAQKGFAVLELRWTNEAPGIGEIMQPSGRVQSKAYIAWVETTLGG